MNHDAKYSGGIFRKRPSTASIASTSTSTSSGRLCLQQNRNGSLSCPASPRKHLPALPVTISDTSLHDCITTSTSFRDGPRIHRSPSANTYNSYGSRHHGQFNYTGMEKSIYEIYLQSFLYTPGSPSAPTSANTSRVDLRNIGRPSTGSVLYLGRTSSLSGSRLSLVSRTSSFSSPHSSPKHRSRQ